MLTDLEKYLSNKREFLDIETPDDQIIWKGIKHKLSPEKTKTTYSGKIILIRIRNAAAVAFMLFALGYITKDIIDNNFLNRQAKLSDFSESLGIKEFEYKSMVNLKTDEAKSFSNTNNLIIPELFEEIRKLDKVYDQALKDLKEIGYNEKIVSTIFDTYEKKIRLLELIILESNKPVIYENNDKIRL